MPTRKIDDLLQDRHRRFTPLQRLLTHSSRQRQWTAELRALLDGPLQHEVEVTDIRGHTAYLLCSSAAAATRLRFLLPEITPRLQALSSYCEVRDFTLRVSTST